MYCFATCGLEKVWVEFDIYDDTLTVESVEFKDIEVITILSDDQIADIENDCWKAVEEMRRDYECDRGQEIYEERMAYAA